MIILDQINAVTGRINSALFDNIGYLLIIPIGIISLWVISKVRNRIRSTRSNRYEIISTNKWYKEKEDS